jgi:3-hydroxyisobutyrate dehydrogenase-like beta-hydroxyacid dehydrogenase
MPIQQIGILSIGEMGFHWARVLTGRGVAVLTYAKDRSETTRKRAENLGVECVQSIDALVKRADLIVSIVVPFAAKRVASRVARAAAKAQRTDLLYLDANAISPMTAREIGDVLAHSGVDFVDGCIIGSAAKIDKRRGGLRIGGTSLPRPGA